MGPGKASFSRGLEAEFEGWKGASPVKRVEGGSRGAWGLLQAKDVALVVRGLEEAQCHQGRRLSWAR